MVMASTIVCHTRQREYDNRIVLLNKDYKEQRMCWKYDKERARFVTMIHIEQKGNSFMTKVACWAHPPGEKIEPISSTPAVPPLPPNRRSSLSVIRIALSASLSTSSVGRNAEQQ